MVKNLSERCLHFLYEQVKANKISQIKKGMCEDLEQFVSSFLEELEANQIADRMQAKKPEKTKRQDVEIKGAANE